MKRIELRMVGALLAVLALAGSVQAQENAGPINVDDAVEIALNRNYTYRRSQAGVEVAKGSRMNSLAAILPSLNGSLSISRSEQTSTSTLTEIDGMAVPQIDLPRNSLSTNRSGGITLSENVGFDSWMNYKASQAAVTAARHGVTATRQDIAFQVRQQFYLVLRAQDLLTVQEEDYNLAQDEQRRIQTMFDLGSVAKVDVLKAQVRVADADVALIRQRNLVDIEKSRLATLIGLDATTPLELVGNLEISPAPVDSAQAYSELDGRPDLQAGRAEVLGASRNQKAAAYSRLPSLFASFNLDASSGDSEIDQLDFNDNTGQFSSVQFNSENSSDGFTIRAGASLNLDAFLNSGRAKLASAQREQAEYDLANLRLLAQQELQEAILNQRTSLRAIAAAERGVEAAEEDLRLSRERYQQGLGTILEFTESQVALTRARNTLVDAKTTLKIAEAALDRARGAPVVP